MAYMSEDELRAGRKKLKEDFGEQRWYADKPQHTEDSGSHIVGIIGMAVIGYTLWAMNEFANGL